MTRYVANVVAVDEPLVDGPMPVEAYLTGAEPKPVGAEGVVVLYGDADAVTCLVDAADEDDAERKIAATWSSGVIDDLGEYVEVPS
jgi:hypothetical protein